MQNRQVAFVSPDHDQLYTRGTRGLPGFVLGPSVTYQLERVQCGKRRCRRWHGPYWYAYWSEGGRTRSLYIGKKLRPAGEVVTERIERKRAAAAAHQLGEDK